MIETPIPVIFVSMKIIFKTDMFRVFEVSNGEARRASQPWLCNEQRY